MTDLELKMYEAFDCRPPMLGWGGNPQAEGKRAKVDRIYRYYQKHSRFTNDPKVITQRVREEWTAGLGPVASWLMWQAIKYLVKAVVMWIWKYQTTQGLAGNSQV